MKKQRKSKRKADDEYVDDDDYEEPETKKVKIKKEKTDEWDDASPVEMPANADVEEESLFLNDEGDEYRMMGRDNLATVTAGYLKDVHRAESIFLMKALISAMTIARDSNKALGTDPHDKDKEMSRKHKCIVNGKAFNAVADAFNDFCGSGWWTLAQEEHEFAKHEPVKSIEAMVTNVLCTYLTTQYRNVSRPEQTIYSKWASGFLGKANASPSIVVHVPDSTELMVRGGTSKVNFQHLVATHVPILDLVEAGIPKAKIMVLFFYAEAMRQMRVLIHHSEAGYIEVFDFITMFRKEPEIVIFYLRSSSRGVLLNIPSYSRLFPNCYKAPQNATLPEQISQRYSSRNINQTDRKDGLLFLMI